MKNKSTRISKKRPKRAPSKRARAMVEKLNNEVQNVEEILKGADFKKDKGVFANLQTDHKLDQQTKTEKSRENDDLERQLDLLSGITIEATSHKSGSESK
ncbi:putative secreted protein [Ogataea parapolymorpha DL-1]|uniref:Secreted protein n=1 Tax=Ogataea parapolymorpha (strain ATCC 26012 / BCRC 20466 / JCM 22074 / NRRL Y-7560 / DL-1) TaxID=871575 RepID=W1QJ48_OGAPD|nr:putative secreted protein [Ogataea parapolymorpha DL-1]ESX00994.1 putative secreted protein [Ogataea parapolymorpha DL-1]